MTPAGFTIRVRRQLRTVRRQVPTSVFQSLIVALVLSRLDDCNSVLFGHLLTSSSVSNLFRTLLLG